MTGTGQRDEAGSVPCVPLSADRLPLPGTFGAPRTTLNGAGRSGAGAGPPGPWRKKAPGKRAAVQVQGGRRGAEGGARGMFVDWRNKPGLGATHGTDSWCERGGHRENANGVVAVGCGEEGAVEGRRHLPSPRSRERPARSLRFVQSRKLSVQGTARGAGAGPRWCSGRPGAAGMCAP